MTTLAVGVLALDAALLFVGAIQFDRPWLFLPGAACAVGAAAVIVAWRRHLRNLAEIDVMIAARQAELQREAAAIRELLLSQSSED
jgi:hypothetical protein